MRTRWWYALQPRRQLLGHIDRLADRLCDAQDQVRALRIERDEHARAAKRAASREHVAEARVADLRARLSAAREAADQLGDELRDRDERIRRALLLLDSHPARRVLTGTAETETDASDTVVACADLVGRAGATELEIGWDCPHVPDVPDDHNCPQVVWHATAKYRGARITVDRHRSPSAAALALAERLLSGATCRCRQPVALSDDRDGCRWRLNGQRWEPGCDAEPITVAGGQRGDMAAMEAALHRPANRAERRAERKRGGRRG